MDGFGTSTEQMAQAGAHVHAVNTAVQSELSALRAKLAPLAGLWTGPAAAQFVALMTRWDTDARGINDALDSIGDAITTSGVAYQVQEDDQARSMSTITAALG